MDREEPEWNLRPLRHLETEQRKKKNKGSHGTKEHVVSGSVDLSVASVFSLHGTSLWCCFSMVRECVVSHSQKCFCGEFLSRAGSLSLMHNSHLRGHEAEVEGQGGQPQAQGLGLVALLFGLERTPSTPVYHYS